MVEMVLEMVFCAICYLFKRVNLQRRQQQN